MGIFNFQFSIFNQYLSEQVSKLQLTGLLSDWKLIENWSIENCKLEVRV